MRIFSGKMPKKACHTLIWIVALIIGLPRAVAAAEVPAVAFFYGANPPWEILQAFDLVVVDPDHVPNPRMAKLGTTRLAAYVAVVEVQPSRRYAAKLPKRWLLGEDKTWGSLIIDQSVREWPEFFVTEVIAPLWEAGYRDFFLDTLDSYQKAATTTEARVRQEEGLIRVIRAIKTRFPDARLIFNRGFEIMAQVSEHISAVAAESLFEGYDAAKKKYRPVAPAEREWLRARLERVRHDYKVPVIVIDYVASAERDKARQTAQRIAELGYIPWVANAELDAVGIGLVEAMPRRILAVHEPLPDDHALRYHSVIRHAQLPLNHLGYMLDVVSADRLPKERLVGQIAGVVVWLGQPLDTRLGKELATWLDEQISAGIPVVLLGDIGFIASSPLARKWGIVQHKKEPLSMPVSIETSSGMVGLERKPMPHPREFYPLEIDGGEPQLVLRQGAARQVAVALTPWGGFAVDPYVIVTLAGEGEERWVLDPFVFFKAALRLPDMPVPDLTTESGRRMLMVHMDGDGFPSRAEMKGAPYAGALIRDRIVRRYRIPMTISVIEGEISPEGLYPEDSPALEAIARDIFAEPHVEIASHSHSHPFVWRKAAVGASGRFDGYTLRIPGYRFDVRREIEGSIRYIESRLAPPGKRATMFLWTGDCMPDADALALVDELGLQNMNGGDTTATRSSPTLTRVEGVGMVRGGHFQVFAPNQNENVYTNNWTGPFHGYRRVIETFVFTENPRRLKPIDIYFHAYIATKPEGLRSLEEVFAWVLQQETTPVFASEYARKASNFRHLSIARTPQGWRVRGAHALRTLRWPLRLGWPALDRSKGVAGYVQRGEEGYLHLVADEAWLEFTNEPPSSVRLVSANGRIKEFRDDNGKSVRWRVEGHVPLELTLAHAARCQVYADGHPLPPLRHSGESAHFLLKRHAAATIEARCR